jgi:uncharacterized protein (DUF433 family)
MGDLHVLERPVYGVLEAAELLGLRSDRARAWLDGYVRAGTSYEPVIRPQRTGSDVVTWGEFVELGWLREYRTAGVSLQHLRPVVQRLRAELGTPYPLATARPYVADKQLVLEIQEREQLPANLAIVVRTGQTLMLSGPAERFLRKVDFQGGAGEATRLLPAGRTSPVVMDPVVRFGRPTVDGVATERLWELYDAGEAVEDIARDYEMPVDKVEAAIAYEEQAQTQAA